MGNQPAAADAHRCTAAAVRRGMLHGAWSCRPWDNGPFNHPDDAPTHRPTLNLPLHRSPPEPCPAPYEFGSSLRLFVLVPPVSWCACTPPGAGGTSVGVSPLSETRTARDRFAQIGLALRQFVWADFRLLSSLKFGIARGSSLFSHPFLLFNPSCSFLLFACWISSTKRHYFVPQPATLVFLHLSLPFHCFQAQPYLKPI